MSTGKDLGVPIELSEICKSPRSYICPINNTAERNTIEKSPKKVNLPWVLGLRYMMYI